MEKNIYKIGKELFITNEEEIKDYNWYISSDGKLLQFTGRNVLGDKFIAPKVIITTDQDLIADGVQAIDDEFLEWFCNNSSCEEVEVEKIKQYKGNYLDCFHTQGQCDCGLKPCKQIFFTYKIIIPKEEPKHPKVFSENGNELFFDEQGNMIKEEPKQEDEYIGECKGNDGNGCFMDSCGHNCGCFKKKPKQETLEEVAKSKAFEFKVDYKPFETNLNYGEYAEFGFEKGFIAGAKSDTEEEARDAYNASQERMYSEEEVYRIASKAFLVKSNNETILKDFAKWFKQYKK